MTSGKPGPGSLRAHSSKIIAGIIAAGSERIDFRDLRNDGAFEGER
jgi:hypothetical protein